MSFINMGNQALRSKECSSCLAGSLQSWGANQIICRQKGRGITGSTPIPTPQLPLNSSTCPEFHWAQSLRLRPMPLCLAASAFLFCPLLLSYNSCNQITDRKKKKKKHTKICFVKMFSSSWLELLSLGLWWNRMWQQQDHVVRVFPHGQQKTERRELRT